MTSNPTTKSIAITTAISFSIAVLVLIGAVLPAEFGIDPLGTGKALGLLDLYVTDTTHTSSTAQTDDYVTHDIEIPLSPFESMEFKYHLAAGAGMVYNWDASGEVLFDFHGEADDAEPGEARSEAPFFRDIYCAFFRQARVVLGKPRHQSRLNTFDVCRALRSRDRVPRSEYSTTYHRRL